MKASKRELKNYMSMMDQDIPGSHAIAKQLKQQGFSDPDILKYLMRNAGMGYDESIEIIRQLNRSDHEN